MTDVARTRTETREMFAVSGLRYEHITPDDISDLRRKLAESLKASSLMRGSLRITQRGKRDVGPEGVRFVQIRCACDYFDDREAVTFNSDGMIGFAGWADDSNVVPILSAFGEWTRETAARNEVSYQHQNNARNEETIMTNHPEAHVYMTSRDKGGKMAAITEGNPTIVVAISVPREGSNTERDLSDVLEYTDDDIDNAVKDFFGRMTETGLPGVLDTPEVRVHQKDPLAFCEALTETIIDEVPDNDDPDARDDDFDNHPLSLLREVMVDNCTEFSGESPSP